MSGLRERLLRHKKTEQAAPSAAAPAEISREADEQGEWSFIGAQMEHNERGSFVLRRIRYGNDFRHGRYAIGDLEGQADELLSILLPGDVEAAAEGMPYDKLLYLDTETTGLGVGAGNVAFMIGIGFYEDRQFVVEQMFIRNPAEELAMLHHLQERLQRHPYLVSYNGKTFDWPLIKNRYILNRIPSEPDIAGHLDFLYPSRSLWKHTLPSCRLGKVEEDRLHVERQDDLPGSMAPALYFQYLADKDATVVKGIFIHNELDILSLAGLSIHFARILRGEFSLSEMGLEEHFRLGLWFLKLQLSSYAEDVLDQLKERLLQDDSGEQEEDYLLPLAQVYKQTHDYETACRLWTAYVLRKGHRSMASVEPYIELSMHYEHREKRLLLALQYAEEALNKARQRKSLARPGLLGARGRKGMTSEEKKQNDQTAELEKRLARLKSKIERLNNVNPAARKASEASGRRSGSRRRAAGGETGYSMDSLI
ncbi:ribonuclease H-like domain-containing protein [Paenibacillus sp. NPDC056579]|uniref:ribonuclease H-like domain-containing protein n=1 Tax=Paenibacillus sp. NPDC056579 TaxID=3345871 RepID=UPI0036C1A6C0